LIDAATRMTEIPRAQFVVSHCGRGRSGLLVIEEAFEQDSKRKPPPSSPNGLKTTAHSHRQRKPRPPTLASVSKQASKAGIEVARYEFKPDGTITIVTGQPESASPEDPWLADLRKGTKQ
jgi:hypothetical protein